MWYKSSEIAILVSFLLGGIVIDLAWYWLWRTRLSKRHAVNMAPERPVDWQELASGESGDIEIERAWLRTVQELYGIFCAKQHDYGPTNIGTGGLKGVVLRMGDKVSRLWEINGLTVGSNEKDPTLKVNESVRDSLLDLADYGIIGTLVLNGDWPLYTPQDVWGADAARKLLRQLEEPIR